MQSLRFVENLLLKGAEEHLRAKLHVRFSSEFLGQILSDLVVMQHHKILQNLQNLISIACNVKSDRGSCILHHQKNVF